MGKIIQLYLKKFNVYFTVQGISVFKFDVSDFFKGSIF